MNTRILCLALIAAFFAASCQNSSSKSKSPSTQPVLANEGVKPPPAWEARSLYKEGSSNSKALQPDDSPTAVAAGPAATVPAVVLSTLPSATGPGDKGSDSSATLPNIPIPPRAELLQPTTDMAGYGVERYRIVSAPDEVIAVLMNGTTVICRRVTSPAVSVRGYCYTGSVYEGKWLGGGLSHLLEHLVAFGSNEKRTEQETRDLLQKIGNDSNAYTTDDHTAYFINTTTEHMASAVDLVCNSMLGAKITPEEYRREYLVVQRELEMGKGEPHRVFYYMTATNRFRVNPSRVPVIGYQEVIQALSRDDVYEYYKLAYVPNNLVFSVAGDLDPEKMLDAVKQHVKHAKPGRDFSRDIAAEPQVVSPRTLVGTFPGLGQAKLQLAFPTVQLQHEDLYALDLLATVLGGGESSLFTEELRDKKELVSGVAVMSWTPSYTDGAFQIDMELDAAKVPQATAATLELLEKVKTDGVDDKRLARAKTQMRANRVKSMQTAEDIASLLAVDFMSTGDPHFNKHYVERIEKVTPKQIKAVAAKYFDQQKLLTTALLPTEFAPTLPKAEQLLRPATPASTQPAAKAADGQIVKVDLDENTVLLTKRITTTPLVVMQMYTIGGLTAEDEKNNGLGNLTMQMVARGTKTRSAQDISAFWDSIGGDFDASCGNNSWSWTATCMKDDVAKAYDVFADLVNNPSFPDAELKPLKGRVLAAIQGQDADWADQAFRFFKATYYHWKSPYRFMVTGTPANVESFTSEQVREFYASSITPRKKVIAIFGDVDPREIEAMIRKTPLAKTDRKVIEEWGTIIPEVIVPADKTPPVAGAKPPAGQVWVEKVALNKTEQALAGIVVGYRADTVVGKAENFPIAVGDTMASGYQYGAGYLYEILRGRGLVYVVHGQNSPGRNDALSGTFLVYAGCEPDKVNEVVDVIMENIARLQGSPDDVNVDWFQRSKELIVVAEALDNQTPAKQATQAALDELYGLGYNWHQKFADRVKGVTLDQVREVARSKLSRCVVTVSTPKPELVTTKEGQREYKSFPRIELTPRGIQHDSGK